MTVIPKPSSPNSQAKVPRVLIVHARSSPPGVVEKSSSPGGLEMCIRDRIRPTTGQVLVNGVDISKISEKELLQVRRKELAMVFQNFGLLPCLLYTSRCV